MPRWLRTWLRSDLKFHLAMSLGLALALRTICSYFVFGPQALDDFNHAVMPAYNWLIGRPLNVPGYRSELLVWILAGLMRMAQGLGVDSPVGQLRACYFGLGLFSLIGLYGTYLLAKTSRSRLFGATALYLVAIFPMMPFVSTRTSGESIAMSFILLGIGLLESHRQSHQHRFLPYLLGFLALGAATLFRFQVGLLFVCYAACMVILRQWQMVGAALLAGFLAALAQGVIDLASGKQFLETLYLYIKENNSGGERFGVTPWYTTWLLFLGMGVAPVSFLFWSRVRSLWRRHWPWLASMLIFVFAHSLIPHKEERFLYPVFGLEIWALAWLWSASARMIWPQRIFSPLMFYLLLPVSLALCVINTQAGSVEPQAVASSRFRDAVVVFYGVQEGVLHYKDYFLRSPIVVERGYAGPLTASNIDETLSKYPTSSTVFLMTSDLDKMQELTQMAGRSTATAKCQALEASGSITDRILFALNPRHNQRRRPTWYLACARR